MLSNPSVPANHFSSVQVLLTSQNIFIANLALSDLLLCTFTMPLTLLDLLNKYWPLGPDMDTVGVKNYML